MGRPPLPVGTYGEINVREERAGKRAGGSRWRARCRFRDYDGQVRYVVRYGASKSAATAALKVAVRDRQEAAGAGEITRDSRVRVLAETWLRDDVRESQRAASTKARYDYLVRSFIVPGVGELRVGEFTTGAADRFLRAVREKNGPATARTVRACLSQMFAQAVRLGALTTNPMREVSRIPNKREPARALTREEAQRLVSALRADERAVQLDLVDLVEFMLGTGARIGEVCALRPAFVDLDAGTVEIAATMTDAGGLEERTKTTTGHRVLAVPDHVVGLLRRRLDDPSIPTDVVLFASPTRKLRDSSNTAAALRRAFDRAGFPWVRSHTLRKSVATWLDDAGLTARQIADHLGHAQVSMTTDVYMGRRTATPAAAAALRGF